MPSVYKTVASGTTDVQVHTGATIVSGMTVVAAGATTVTLHDGTSAAGPPIVSITTAAAGGQTLVLPDVRVFTGLFADRGATNAAAVTVFLTL